MPALWPKFDPEECAAFRTLLADPRLHSAYRFKHCGEFMQLLDDRMLMSAVIHVSGCLNGACRAENGRLQRMFGLNPEIPAGIIGKMESWRSKVEGWPPHPPRTEAPHPHG